MDTKLQTFLTLCRLMNYRMTAEHLHLTQPAVTKQIQALEQLYNTKLFEYDGKRLSKTKSCAILEQYCESLKYNYEEIKKALVAEDELCLRIGATKTIGDYVLSPLVLKHLSKKNNGLSLDIENTERLLISLDNSELDFAVIEGFFNKNKYGHRLLRREPFVGVCHKNSPLAGRTVSIDDILNQTLIVRESGSGTRDVLEHELKSLGYGIEAFSRVVYISSFKLIREMILQDIGISFLYSSVIEDDDSFATFQIENFKHEHEFNIVYLKNTCAEKYVNVFFDS